MLTAEQLVVLRAVEEQEVGRLRRPSAAERLQLMELRDAGCIEFDGADEAIIRLTAFGESQLDDSLALQLEARRLRRRLHLLLLFAAIFASALVTARLA